MTGFLKRIGIERALGSRPSPVRAAAAAAIVGGAVAGLTYRALRLTPD